MKSKAFILLLVLFAVLLFSSAEVPQDEKKSAIGDKESQVEKEIGDVKYGCRRCCYYGRCRCCYPNEYPAEEYNEAIEANYVPERWGGGGHGGGGGWGGGGRGGGWGGGRGGGRGGGW